MKKLFNFKYKSFFNIYIYIYICQLQFLNNNFFHIYKEELNIRVENTMGDGANR